VYEVTHATHKPADKSCGTLYPERIYTPDIESQNWETSLNTEFFTHYISIHSDIQDAINHEIWNKTLHFFTSQKLAVF
jgi:hypothetical protein